MVTLILTIPIYIMSPTLEALVASILLLFPFMVVIGFLVALFTAYILAPFSLRRLKPYQEDPQIVQFVENITEKAKISPVKLLVWETPEINAMAFTSPWGGRVCLTRGLIERYHKGDFSADELQAIIGHEVEHIKNGDCLKGGFVCSWVSIFHTVGTICMALGALFGLGGGIAGFFRQNEVGKILGLMGLLLLVFGAVQRLLGKIASIPAYHLERQQEYAADLAGAKLVSPEAHISALSKIENLNSALEVQKLAQLPFAEHWQTQPMNQSWIDRLFSTHPATEDRVEELKKLHRYL